MCQRTCTSSDGDIVARVWRQTSDHLTKHADVTLLDLTVGQADEVALHLTVGVDRLLPGHLDGRSIQDLHGGWSHGTWSFTSSLYNSI